MGYIVITEDVANANSWRLNGPNVFLPMRTNEGVWVCDDRYLEMFPDIFDFKNLEQVELDRTAFMPDYAKLEVVVDNKYQVLSREENYYDKTVKLVYIMDGEKKEVVESMDHVVATKDGYSIDMVDKIRMKETATVKAEEITKENTIEK